MRRNSKFSLIVALSLTLTAPLLAKELFSKELLPAKNAEAAKSSGGGTTARKRDSDREAEAKVSRLPIRLTQVQNEGLRAQPEKYDNPEFREAYYLLSINGVQLAGKSAQDIKKFLRGNLGESAVLGILNRDMEYKEFSFPYEMLRRDELSQIKKSNVRGMLYNFDGTNGPREHAGSRGDEFELYNLPIFASAWAEQTVFDALDSPATSNAVVDNAAAESAEYLLKIGKIEQAKHIIKILQQSSLEDTKNRRRETDKYAKLMPLLDLWGMNREAVSIGTKLVGNPKPAVSSVENERYYDTNSNRLQTVIAFSKVIKSSADGGTFDSTLQAIADQPFNRYSNSYWLAEYFDKVGKFDQAISSYERALAQYEKPGSTSASPNLDLSTARARAYLLVRLAQMEDKRGGKADDYLKRAAEVYRANFNNDQLALIERIPGFSPSLSQIESVISSAKNREKSRDKKGDNKLLAILTPTVAQSNPSDKELEFATVTLSVYAALEKADFPSAQRSTAKLFEIYKQVEIRPNFPRPSINLFCTLLSIAEQFSNKGRFEQANKILDQLKAAEQDFDANDASAFFIDVEQTLNASHSKNSENSWKSLNSNWNSGYQEYEGLRALAALYTNAGDTTRASILLERAISLCKVGSDKNQPREIALLYLDKAWLEASQEHFVEAERYFKQSIETVDSTKVSGLSRDLDNFNRQYICTAIKLAQAYRSKAKTALAEEALKAVISRIDSGKSWLGVFEQSSRGPQERSVPSIYYYYARLLADKGDYTGARPYLDKAIAASKNNVPGIMRFVRAKVAASQKDYECAALDYLDVSQQSYDHDVQALIMMQPDLKESYGRRALEFALKAKKLSGEEMAEIYTKLADSLHQDGIQRDSSKEQLELYNKAFPLLADGREKQQLAIKIANLSGQQNATAVSASSPAAKVDHAAEFKMREAAASIAQKNTPNNAAQLWVELANSEIGAKQYDSAITHLEAAVAAIQRPPANFEVSFMQSFSFYMMPLGTLAAAGKEADAVAIGKLLLAKADNLYGKLSSQYRQALTAMFSLNVGQKDYKTANQYLDQILAIDPRKYELGRSSSNSLCSLEGIALGLAFKDDSRAYGMEVLGKLLTNSLNTYGPDDVHTMDILSKIGSAETKAGNFAEAEKHLKMATAIANLYDLNGSFTFYSSPIPAMRELLSAQKKTDELKQLDDQSQIYRKEAEKNWSLADNASIDATQKFYDYWHKKSPYSIRALNSGIKLLESAGSKKDWPTVKSLAPECIKMLAHNSPFLVGGCTPSPSPATRKFSCFTYLIQAYIATGERQQALNWLKRAQSEKSYVPMTEELLFLSNLENLCGNKKEALELCRQAEKTLPSDGQWNYYRGTVNELYQKIGSEADIQRIRLEGQATQLIRYEEEVRKSERERKEKAADEATRKKLPAEATATSQDSSTTNRSGKSKGESEWRPEPANALVLEPVKEVQDTYKFDYAALASSNLWLADGAFVKQRMGPFPFPSYSFAGSFEGISTHQPIHKAGSLSFLYDGPNGSLTPKFDIQQMMKAHPGGTGGTGGSTGGGGGQNLGNPMSPYFSEAPAVMSRPFRPALTGPTNSTVLDGKSLTLQAGDYIADKLTVERILMPQPGRVRIFIKDNSVKTNNKIIETKKPTAPGYHEDATGISAFTTTAGAFINKSGPWDAFQQRSNLEIWYNGTDTIRLGDQSKFTGIIYAPNATIKLGKDVEFVGAMVGKNIFAGEGTTIMYLPQLRYWKPD
ncbi:hypothetical protein BH11CYA1_BH11CYA1_00190 [soil metagenome]